MAEANETVEVRGVPVDGRFYITDDLTFAEQHELRHAARESSGRESAELDEIDGIDIIPGIIWLVRRRTNQKYTLEHARQLTGAEVSAMYEEAKANAAAEAAAEKSEERPTRRSPAARAKAK